MSHMVRSHCLMLQCNYCSINFTAKFGCTVPGTLMNYDNECHINTYNSELSSPTTSSHHTTTSYSEMEIIPDSSSAANTFEIGSPGFYIIAGVAGGIFILVVIILVLSMIVGCLATNKRDPCTSGTVTTQLHLHNLVQLQVETPGKHVHVKD